jgi:hypothetical protein
MNVVALYIIDDSVSKRIELFNDEKISVTSSIQNANDIGKVFTDYSQSFTIPASKNNNKIFKHWYESEVDNSFEHGKRYDGYIEINTVTFKKGNFQLEKANRKNGMIESYTITFYGNLTQLKDLFKDDKLNTLDYSSLNHTYNSINIRNRISAAIPYSVMYPLLGSAKKFEYKTANTLEDITLSTGAIKWNELFPAINLTDIITFIQNKYGITFTGSFLDLFQWKKLRLYCKNAENLLVPTEQKLINLPIITGVTPFSEYNNTNSSITTNYNFGTSVTTNKYISIDLDITPNSASLLTKYRIFVYRNGVLLSTYSDLMGIQTVNAVLVLQSWSQGDNVYTFKIDSENSITTAVKLKYKRGGFNPGLSIFSSISYAETTTLITVGNIEIKNFVPDITVSDFVIGLVKMFNLMIIPTSKTSFELIPLELYYQAGNVNDVTKYIRSEEADIERPKLFKSINFQYEKSSNVLNNAFYRINNLEYGDLVLNNDNVNENQSYEIKLPFENLLFERASIGSNIYNFETATFIDKDLKPYTPKPLLIYENGLTSVSSFPIYVTTTGSTPVTINNYNRYSNEYSTVPTDLNYLMSSNFGEYQSPWYSTNASNGLYKRHYENYIANLYNPKTRIVKVKAVIPDMVLSTLKLNDRLIIRDKRYIINQFTSDLTTGETDFELINDYRGADAASTVGYKFSSSDAIMVDNTAKSVDYVIYLNEYDSFDILPDTGNVFVRWSDSTDNIADTNLLVTVDANATAVDRNETIGIEYFKNGVSVLTTYLNVLQYA